MRYGRSGAERSTSLMTVARVKGSDVARAPCGRGYLAAAERPKLFDKTAGVLGMKLHSLWSHPVLVEVGVERFCLREETH